MIKIRELATIEHAATHLEDYGGITCVVRVGYDQHGIQGFDGMIAKQFLDDYIKTLCETFDVRSLEELVGKRCAVLRCWPDDSRIEGLETEDGRKRFTTTAWCRKVGLRYESPLAQRRSELLNDIAYHDREKQRLLEQLELLGKDYVEWS